MRIPIVLAFAVAACAGDSPPPSGQCIGLLYQVCNEEHDCDQALCQNFAGEFQVCTQACDASNPCPAPGVCDELNVCKPPAPDECTL